MRSNTNLLRIVLHGSLVSVLLQLATSPLLARDTTFNPRIALSGSYTDNVRFVEGSEEASDFSTSIRVTLPVERQTRHSALLFQYDVRASKFSEFSSLDNLENRLLLNYSARISRVSSISLRARYAFTQDQANPVILEDSLDPDPFLSVRTKRETYQLSLGYGRNIGRRWNWNGSIGARGIDHSVIGGFDPQGDPALIPEDKTGYRVSTGFDRRLSGKNSLGAKYTFGITDLERNGRDELHRMRLIFRAGVSKRVTIRGEVGGYRRTNDTQDEATSGLEALLGVSFNEALALGPVRFGFGAGVAPSRGGSLEGTSVNRTIFVSMSGVRTKPVSWRIVARHSERVPDLFGQSERETNSLSARTERSIQRVLGLALSARYVEQTSDDPLQSPSSFYRASAGLVWRPLGKKTRVVER